MANIHFCTRCGTADKKLFYISKSIYFSSTGKLPLCKACMVKTLDEKTMLLGSRELALDDLARMLDIKLIKSTYESVKTEEDTSIFISKYFRNIALKSAKDDTYSYYDSDFDITENTNISNDYSEEDEEEYQELNRRQLAMDWGNGFSDSDYIFLEKRYSKLSTMANIEYESDVVIIRQICLEELNLRKVREKGGTTKDALRTIQELMSTASIRPTDIKAANAGALSSYYGKWIDQIEETEPAEFFKDKSLYEDYDGLGQYFKDWILRPLKNLLTGSRDFNIGNK